MKTTLDELIAYVKNPTNQQDPNTRFLYRLKKVGSILSICFASTFILTILLSFLEGLGLLETGKHAIEDILNTKNDLLFFVLAVIVAPLVEETIFRAPLTLFKSPKNFRIAFYTSTFLFGYMHLFNYELTSNVLIFSPILVAPQLVIGWYLGFARIRFGLLWSIVLHGTYNGILVSLFLLAKNAIH